MNCAECAKCELVLCGECLDNLHKPRVYQTHVSFYKPLGYLDLQRRERKQRTCSRHPDKMLELLCLTDNLLVCAVQFLRRLN